jgi:hypothetical protein
MSNMTSSPVEIQTSPQSVPSTPSWFGEVAVVAHYLSNVGLLEKMVLEVRFSRKRFGIYDTIDFLCVLIGYTLSGRICSELPSPRHGLRDRRLYKVSKNLVE